MAHSAGGAVPVERTIGLGSVPRIGDHVAVRRHANRDRPVTQFSTLLTPCLLLDEAVMQSNATRFLDHAARLGVTLRPHVKTSKCVEAALVGCGGRPGPITVSTLAEADHFARHGFTDILYAVGIVPAKLPAVRAIHRATGATLRLVTDSIAVARSLAAECTPADAGIGVLVELDAGAARAGLPPDAPEIVEIARLLNDSGQAGGIGFDGLMAYSGHSYGFASAEEHRMVSARECAVLREATDRLKEAGLPCPIRSVGSSPSFIAADRLDGATEARAGVHIFFDLDQMARGVCRLEDIAVTVLSTVIGHNRAARHLVIDAGGLALSKDLSARDRLPGVGYGWLLDGRTGARLEELAVGSVSQEHGVVPVPDAAWFERLPVGSLVRVVPHHTCFTCAAHDGYHVLRRGQVADYWPRVNGWAPRTSPVHPSAAGAQTTLQAAAPA